MPTGKAPSPKLKPPGAGAWTFRSAAVAQDFDRHVREQLPWYSLATGLVIHVARHFIPQGGLVVDVGASTGNIGNALAPIIKLRSARYVAIDASEEMAKVYSGPGELVVEDARDHDFSGADLIVCFLVLMFVPVADRSALIGRMRAGLRPGGAIVIFDKLEPEAGQVGIISSRLTLAAKYEAGAPPEEIIAKELSLAGVQRPLRQEELTGFAQLFRFGDFGGWIACA